MSVSANHVEPDAASQAAIRFAKAAVPGQTVRRTRFNRADWRQLTCLYGAIAILHVVGWGLFLRSASLHPTLAGLGLAAYLLGLRHAFDADHIAAVDDSARLLMQTGKRPLAVGFYFSLGHATVVLLVAVGLIMATATFKSDLPQLREVGGLLGAGISGVCLWVVGLMNLPMLLDIGTLRGRGKTGHHSHVQLEQLLSRRGLTNRLLSGRLRLMIRHSWQMFPLGLLFGLGFDTASEVGLLGITAGTSVGNMPWAAGLSLPILFAAGISVMDTTDGVLMIKAYEWAYTNPTRKIYYNLTTTGLSIAVAFFVGTLQLLQVFTGLLKSQGRFVDHVRNFDIGALGYYVVAMLLAAWAVSLVRWKWRRSRRRLLSEPSQNASGISVSPGSGDAQCLKACRP